ncbi:hypothetical protein K1719_021886 [Acacia pycnantha]|nr:hypothetical protein K1719_021886 [Acacia pycnantha]
MPRYGDADSTKGFGVESNFTFHIFNSFEDGDEVFDLFQSDEKVKERRLCKEKHAIMDFPMINAKFTGKPKCGGIAKIYFEELGAEVCIVSSEETNTRVEYHMFEKNLYCTGAAFVPKDGGLEEHDGWVITFVHNEDTDMFQDRLQKMCDNLCGLSSINCLLLFFMFSSYLPNAEARDKRQIPVSTTIVLLVLSIMFTIILVLLAYTKFCRISSFELMNSSIHPQNLTRSEQFNFCGIDKQVIQALPVFEFSLLKGSKEGLGCVVCLSKFENGETLRLLPKCKHAFHMNCIDTWLEGHSTCPLCRCRIDLEDIKNLTSSISSRFLRAPSNLTEEPDLEIFVLREQKSSQGSLRINSESGLGDVEEGKKEEEVPIDNSGNREIMHKFNHRILISGFVTRGRWSDLTATDLLFLNAEMQSVMSSRRFLASESDNGELSRRISNLSYTSNEEQNWYNQLNWDGKRSMSEITIVPRLKEMNRMKILAASEDNNGE